MESEMKKSTRHEEYQYLEFLEKIMKEGITKPNRTANKTKSLFGNTMRFTLSELQEGSTNYRKILPLLTTKNMSKTVDIIFKELEFFISGKTDNKILKNQGVKIWNANGSREFLDLAGLQKYQEDDLGPIYGWQWRHFGAEYESCQDDYSGKGFDQLQWVIDEIKKNPYSRRLLVTAWNPLQIKEMCLPPCHSFFQFVVDPDESGTKPTFLSCTVYQRSADLPLGVPFNIASYATLTHIVADLTGLIAKELFYITIDSHIYENQLEFVPIQTSRVPYPFPSLEFDFINRVKTIDDYKAKHMKVIGYQSHPTINYPFSV